MQEAVDLIVSERERVTGQLANWACASFRPARSCCSPGTRSPSGKAYESGVLIRSYSGSPALGGITCGHGHHRHAGGQDDFSTR